MTKRSMNFRGQAGGQLTPSNLASLMTHYGIKCPTCHSTAPHMHPAVQHEGEVETCPDEFHLAPTPQNKPEYIARVLAKRAEAKHS